ncbi:glycosyltransferase [Psychroserpens sp. NJDZ02]|uniref:glycosyltransferase n=1 Tax=Psychroserpens sp. NJDZ02 TaxID=2570561 RepID=UPI0010A93592|nr:glycosyltransferase [Psychroserpens sp. NJDZ02]QCE43409.1 glycosyltransferase [Psychroserpens sp. NJDZ02]
MELRFSFIIPVYNRPVEIEELLESFSKLNGNFTYEIVIVEDGSSIISEAIIDKYKQQLDIAYYFKPNSGPGDSRNFGMRKAKGNYFIILDSDCLLPSNYLLEVSQHLQHNYVDCFGGPDKAHQSFTNLQKAIDFSMTSVITTGGIRGNKISLDKFEPRSFNMGLSKKAFEATKGFGNIHPGEDPDLSIRLWDLGFKTTLIPEAYVYHKRRISWSKFYKQVNKFGSVRPILNTWHPQTKKVTYWFPSLFSLGVIIALLLAAFKIYLPIYLVLFYYSLVFISAVLKTKNLVIAFQTLLAVSIQFFGYGYGFLKSTLLLSAKKDSPENIFPHLFFKTK